MTLVSTLGNGFYCMVTSAPLKIKPGQIYRIPYQYIDDDRLAKWTRKYFLVLGMRSDGDVVLRRLTSKQNGRPEHPPCYHGAPYPGFYLGVLGGALYLQSWLTLGPGTQPDYDGKDFTNEMASGIITFITSVPEPVLCNALACAANINVSNRQAKVMRDLRASLGCV